MTTDDVVASEYAISVRALVKFEDDAIHGQEAGEMKRLVEDPTEAVVAR